MVHRKWNLTRYIRMVLPLLYAVYRTDLFNMDEENPTYDCVGTHWNHYGFWQPLLLYSYSRNAEYPDASLSTDKPSPRYIPPHPHFGLVSRVTLAINPHDLDDSGLYWRLSVVERQPQPLLVGYSLFVWDLALLLNTPPLWIIQSTSLHVSPTLA